MVRSARLYLGLWLASALLLACASRTHGLSPASGAMGHSGPLPSGGRLAIDPTRGPYKPTLPPALNRMGLVVAGVYRVCSAADGTVSEVSVIQSADQRVDANWVKTMKGWRYEPFVVAGTPVPLCRKVRLDVRAAS